MLIHIGCAMAKITELKTLQQNASIDRLLRRMYAYEMNFIYICAMNTIILISFWT